MHWCVDRFGTTGSLGNSNCLHLLKAPPITPILSPILVPERHVLPIPIAKGGDAVGQLKKAPVDEPAQHLAGSQGTGCDISIHPTWGCI